MSGIAGEQEVHHKVTAVAQGSVLSRYTQRTLYTRNKCAREVHLPASTMTIEFVILVNRQGETRLSHYARPLTLDSRAALESEAARKCMHRREGDCSFVEHLHYKLIYRRYASLYFIVGVDNVPRQNTLIGYDAHQENDLAVMEFIQAVMECFDAYFESACELDLMYNSEKAHFILEEMLTSGRVGEMNAQNVLQPILIMDAENPVGQF